MPLRVLEPGELARLEPDVEFDVAGALLNAEGAALRIPAFLVEFARMLRKMGVDIRTRTEVLDFEVAGDRVRAVRTSRGTCARPRWSSPPGSGPWPVPASSAST